MISHYSVSSLAMKLLANNTEAISNEWRSDSHPAFGMPSAPSRHTSINLDQMNRGGASNHHRMSAVMELSKTGQTEGEACERKMFHIKGNRFQYPISISFPAHTIEDHYIIFLFNFRHIYPGLQGFPLTQSTQKKYFRSYWFTRETFSVVVFILIFL